MSKQQEPVSEFKPGDEVYGATNRQFSGAYAEYAVPFAGMIAHKPNTLNFVEAASAPIGAVTAWQMLFEYGQVTAGQIILIHGEQEMLAVTPSNCPGKLGSM